MADFSDIPAETRHSQARASDPGASAWVSANAGSGKTFVLAQRVIRLLLDRVEPSRILCLTFTKAAAAEMSNRIFERLGGWVMMDEAGLAGELRNLLGREPGPTQLARARTLFALALDTPGGLKIQTIHAFCEALLHQFPLEANVPGHFEVLDDLRQRELLEQARRLTLGRMDEAGETALRDAFTFLIDHASDAAIEKAVGEIVSHREGFGDWIDGDPAAAMAPLWRAYGLTRETTQDELLAALLANSPVSDAELSRLAEAAILDGGRDNLRFGQVANEYLRAGDPRTRFRLRNDLLLTRQQTARKRLVTRAVADREPELAERLGSAAAQAEEDASQFANWRMLKASENLFVYADALLSRYQSLKRGQAKVDFADLISRAGKLLTRSDVRDWVRYKLDRGIDHVLIDEARDTSPEQWQIIDAITFEFFAGEGAADTVRTVFAVGDEKQSIFSFQGADPAEFTKQEQMISERAKNAGRPFHPVSLNLSFRSSPDILGAVDKVFSLPENARGLGEDASGPVHEAIRSNDPGEVFVWPVLAKTRVDEKSDWLAPIDAEAPDDPAVALARRIATTIAGWIRRGERLPGRDEPIRHGDILILVRKRDRFMTAVIRELKEQGIRIAGADRLKLTEHVAIEDLMALGRVMVMPQDDLSLASVLKSPLFTVSEDALLALCRDRDGAALWDHLASLSLVDGPHRDQATEISGKLERLREVAVVETVYGFYAQVLGREGGRRDFLARLGREAEDVLDAFEEAALSHERNGGAGLEDFLIELDRAEPEIKRENDVRRDEVRVITVHAAKGLEAPIVFLVDPCSPAFIRQHAPSVIEVEAGDGNPAFLWAAGARDSSQLVRDRYDAIRTSAEEEYRRLLYVAMTRAADRLIVCGYRGVREPGGDHWHAMVERALRPDGEEILDGEGQPAGFVWRKLQSRPRAAEPRPRDAEAAPAGPDDAWPDWLWRDAASEPAVARPLNPSAALALLGEPVPDEPQDFPDDRAGDGGERRDALARGTAIHRLLQILPDIEPGDRRAVGERWLAANPGSFDAPSRRQVLDEALQILSDPRLRNLFGANSRAEAGIAGNVAVGKRSVLVSGQIDRLCVGEDEIVLADFKTGRAVPEKGSRVDDSYRLQLALYRALVMAIYPGRRVRCLLVWTRDCSITEFEGAELDAALENL